LSAETEAAAKKTQKVQKLSYNRRKRGVKNMTALSEFGKMSMTVTWGTGHGDRRVIIDGYVIVPR
jgi:hypothetical protein